MGRNKLPPIEEYDVVKYYTLLESLVRDNANKSSDARRVTEAFDQLRAARAAGDADRAAASALCIGFYIVHILGEPVEVGLASLDGAVRGGRPKGSTLERDKELAREFLRRKPSAKCTPTALKERIGAEAHLSRSQAIHAINNGLKKLSG